MTICRIPTMAIVVPTRDRAAMLSEALSSVRAQTVLPDEVIVVDDASNPAVDSRSLRELLHPIPLRTSRHETANGGAASKNAGAFMASSEFVTFLDDDDLLRPDFVELVRKALTSHPSLDLLFVGVEAFGAHAADMQQRMDDAVTLLLEEVKWQQSTDDVKLLGSGFVDHLLKSIPLPFQRPAVRREAFVRTGGMRGYRTWWEGEWAIRAAAHHQAGFLDLRLHRWRVSGQGYFTSRDSTERMLSVDVEIKQRMSREFVGTAFETSARKAAASAYFEQAYWLLKATPRWREALKAWGCGMQLHPSLSGFKSLPRALRDRLRSS